jgi:hypothetical protein
MTALRMAMHAAGYHPVPVLRHDAKDKSAGKRPTLPKWETICATADCAEITSWTTDYSQRECTNTGLLCGEVIGLDIDIPDESLARQVTALADAMLPATPLVRIGKAPKSLRTFRAEAIHRKISTPELFLPNGVKVQVEALGEGNHFVSFGIHPDTRQPYTWPAMSPLDIPFADLPILPEDALRGFLRAAEAVMRAAGGKTERELKGTAQSQTKPSARKANAHRPVNTSAPTRDEVKDALDGIPNCHDWAGWHKIGAAIFDALADDGEDLFVNWSAQSSKDDPEATRAKWRSYRTSPATVTFATLFYEARQNGWKPKTERHSQPEPPPDGNQQDSGGRRKKTTDETAGDEEPDLAARREYHTIRDALAKNNNGASLPGLFNALYCCPNTVGLAGKA